MNSGRRIQLAVFVYIALRMNAAVAVEYQVGSNSPLKEIDQVPLELLKAGDNVQIHWRSKPYRSKFVLCRRGTKERPITIVGVPGPKGELPVIDGRDATTRKQLNYWGEDRAVIKIGGANRPADTMPAHIVIRNLEIRSGRKPFHFTGRVGRTAYRKNAASIYIEKGENILIENCTIHDSGNGIITAPTTTDLTVSGCYLYNNGVEKSLYEHNAYISALRVKFEFNRFGPLRPGCLGNNFKDRSAGLEFTCNWVEGGTRCIDLVDAGHPRLNGSPRYVDSLVIGNVLLKSPQASNNQVVHFGGDSGKTKQYRSTLTFAQNTVVSHRSGNTVLIRRSHANAVVAGINNLVYVAPGKGRLSLLSSPDVGKSEFSGNWLMKGWRISPGSGSKRLSSGENVSGVDPGFRDLANRDFRLRRDSVARGSGMFPQSFRLQYGVHQQSAVRADYGQSRKADIGAFSNQD